MISSLAATFPLAPSSTLRRYTIGVLPAATVQHLVLPQHQAICPWDIADHHLKAAHAVVAADQSASPFLIWCATRLLQVVCRYSLLHGCCAELASCKQKVCQKVYQ